MKQDRTPEQEARFAEKLCDQAWQIAKEVGTPEALERAKRYVERYFPGMGECWETRDWGA